MKKFKKDIDELSLDIELRFAYDTKYNYVVRNGNIRTHSRRIIIENTSLSIKNFKFEKDKGWSRRKK